MFWKLGYACKPNLGHYSLLSAYLNPILSDGSRLKVAQQASVAGTIQLGIRDLHFFRTELPLFWLFSRFEAVSGQECGYSLRHPIKIPFGSALASSESAATAITSDSVELAAAVSAKSPCTRLPLQTQLLFMFEAEFNQDQHLAYLRLHTRPNGPSFVQDGLFSM
ncbi:hypothetical protein ASF12_13515 [Paenibacillus sp. Leaf72]|nr:hypothetical protein ASF12_13515 [Paenibacillus sp. Leaf72]